jgi:hypothetical protein
MPGNFNRGVILLPTKRLVLVFHDDCAFERWHFNGGEEEVR